MAVPSVMKYLLEDGHGGFYHPSIHSFILPWAGFQRCSCDTATVSAPSIVGKAGEWTSSDTKCLSAMMGGGEANGCGVQRRRLWEGRWR